jgi:hypothetical protein
MRDEAERTAAEIKAYMATRDELLRGAKLANRTAQRHPAGSNDWAHNRRLHHRMIELAAACTWLPSVATYPAVLCGLIGSVGCDFHPDQTRAPARATG